MEVQESHSPWLNWLPFLPFFPRVGLYLSFMAFNGRSRLVIRPRLLLEFRPPLELGTRILELAKERQKGPISSVSSPSKVKRLFLKCLRAYHTKGGGGGITPRNQAKEERWVVRGNCLLRVSGNEGVTLEKCFPLSLPSFPGLSYVELKTRVFHILERFLLPLVAFTTLLFGLLGFHDVEGSYTGNIGLCAHFMFMTYLPHEGLVFLL